MEKSNKKLANTVLYYVIALCVAVIIAVTLLTASSKKQSPPLDSIEDITSAQPSQQTESTEKSVVDDDSNKKSETTAKTNEIKEELATENETKPVAIPQKEIYSAPVNGYVSKGFAVDVPVYSITMNDYRAHTGVDFVCEEGSAVASCAAGNVKSVFDHPMMGKTVVIEHSDGVCSYYMNLNEVLPPDITVGANVSNGQLIGAVGSTSMVEIAQEPHLHFEMTVAGAYVDPLSFVDASTITVMSDQTFE